MGNGNGPILGLDIGGTKLAVALATSAGTVLAETQAPSRATEGPEPMIERLADMARAVVSEAGCTIADVHAIGIACGGPLDPQRGIILNALNNPGWVDVPIVDRIEKALGRPAVLDNDANAAALAEHRFGAGRGADDLVYLTISTGIGGGVIQGGRLMHGANGNAGELGHISVCVDAGRRCHCGSVGCLEAYCSGTNIAARSLEAIAAGEASALEALEPAAVTAEAVAAAVRRGDRLARRVWDETMLLLGGAVVSIIHAFNPSVVILGGGVTGSADLLFDPVRTIVGERAMPWLADVVRILPAELGERTGTLGAVAVAIDRAESAVEP
jgi:glucokinase